MVTLTSGQNCLVPSSVLGPHGEMVPVGVFAVDRWDYHKYSWAGLLGKCIPFRFLEKIGIYQHACIVFFALCIPKRTDKISKLRKSYVAAYFLWHPSEHNLPKGPYIFPISPLGRATDWNLSKCTRLWPLYTILWCWPGREIGLTVPSMNPK